ncbi:hypothetical protein, partial [Azotobacter vinelandii]|uniref:hypothetical protein n=1 Tax=Azotobacter vinelandii TaxID=354 RepID=UPI0018D392CC
FDLALPSTDLLDDLVNLSHFVQKRFLELQQAIVRTLEQMRGIVHRKLVHLVHGLDAIPERLGHVSFSFSKIVRQPLTLRFLHSAKQTPQPVSYWPRWRVRGTEVMSICQAGWELHQRPLWVDSVGKLSETDFQGVSGRRIELSPDGKYSKKNNPAFFLRMPMLATPRTTAVCTVRNGAKPGKFPFRYLSHCLFSGL